MQSIFVSSTFQDMHQERDLLHNIVLPEIQEFARSTGKSVTFRDLRWGVDTKALSQEESSTKVIQVCFDEIDDAKPFFVVLLGDRYGWIPDEKLVSTCLEQQKRIIVDRKGKSITELEILYGALERQEPVECLFYFRTITNLRQMKKSSPTFYSLYGPGGIQDSMRMRSLKHRISKKFPRRVRDYHVQWNSERECFDGLDEFTEMVESDLRQLMSRQATAAVAKTWQEQQARQFRYNFESDALEDIPENSGHNTRPLIALTRGESEDTTQGIWVTAPEQRALDVAVASAALVAEKNGWNLLLYDCANSAISTDVHNMLLYLCGCLEHRLGLPEMSLSNESFSTLVHHFQALTAAADERGEKLLIVLRGLDAMNHPDWHLWYPQQTFRNVKFLISGIRADMDNEFMDKNPEVHWNYNSEDYIHLYLKKRRKQIDESVLQTLLSHTQNLPLRYVEGVLNTLLNLNMKDYRAIMSQGGGINAISAYLSRVASQLPRTLQGLMNQMLKRVEPELGPDWAEDLLSILTLTPGSIALEHVEQLMLRKGQPWDELRLSVARRQLGFLLSDTLDGHLHLACEDTRRELKTLLVRHTAVWGEMLLDYMESIPGDDELYVHQYLPLAFSLGRESAFWLYEDRCEQSALKLSLSHILRKQGGDVWLAKAFKAVPSDDRKLHRRLNMCSSVLYPWLKQQELCPQNADIWSPLVQAAQTYYNTAGTHEANRCLFDLLFVLGEQFYLHKDATAAANTLEQAVALAREDMRRWPNRIYCMMNGIPVEEDQKDYELVGGDELANALSGYSYSTYVRITYGYLSSIYEKLDRPVDQALAKAEYNTLTRYLDPNPANRGHQEIALGVTLIMPDALDDTNAHQLRLERQRYNPSLRRNTAIKSAKQAAEYLKEKRHVDALTLYAESNNILEQLVADGETGTMYMLNTTGEEREKEIRRFSSECIRDLGINYDGIVKCLYALERFEECRDAIVKCLEYRQRFDRCRNSLESKMDLERFLRVAAYLYHQLGDPEQHFRMACQLLETSCMVARKQGQFSEECRLNMEEAGYYIYDCIQATPALGTEVTELMLALTNATMKAGKLDCYISLGVQCRDLFQLMRYTGCYWQTDQWTAEMVFSGVMKSVFQILRHHERRKQILQFSDSLQQLCVDLQDTSAKLDFTEMLAIAAFACLDEGDYGQAAGFYRLKTDLSKQLVPEYYSPIALLQDYSKLLPMLSEAGKHRQAEAVGQTALDWIPEVDRRGYTVLEKRWGLTADDYIESRSIILADLFLNMGINYCRLQRPQAMEDCFEKAAAYTRHGKDREHTMNILNRIQMFRSGSMTNKGDKHLEKRVEVLVNQIDHLITKIPQSQLNQFGSIGRELLALLEELEAVEYAVVLVGTAEMALYYHNCSRIFLTIQDNHQGYAACMAALKYAEQVTEPLEFIGELYSNISALVPDKKDQLTFAKRAIALQKELLQRNQLRNPSALAASCFNYAVMIYNALRTRDITLLRASGETHATAASYAREAAAIWKQMVNQGQDTFRTNMEKSQQLATILEGCV